MKRAPSTLTVVFGLGLVAGLGAALSACTSTTTPISTDLAFDGTCVSCHTGLSAAQVHGNFKLRCIDCHGGNDQVPIPDDVTTSMACIANPVSAGCFRDPALLGVAHVRVKPDLARFFWANGVDDDGDTVVDEGPTFATDANGNDVQLTNPGEIFEPGLHGEGPGEFIDSELNRDLNYTRFENPGDLRVATIGCGSGSRAALDGGAGGSCHQDTVDSVRRSIMVNMSAVINGAYYGNESWRSTFQMAQAPNNPIDPRTGGFGYTLAYESTDTCIDNTATKDGPGGRGQPKWDSACLEATAAALDPTIAAGMPGQVNEESFEIAQGPLSPASGVSPTTTNALNEGRFTWGGQPLANPGAALAVMQPVPQNENLLASGIRDPIDIVLRTFRAYYPMNYPGSTTNFNFTFGTSIEPEIGEFNTQDPFGRTHSSGCSSCHARYDYDGSRETQTVRQDDGTFTQVTDPTTKHREFDSSQDLLTIAGLPRLVGRTVNQAQRDNTGREQQRGYSADHTMSAAVDSDSCGRCHGFVTRINYAFQGMAEDEQRDSLARKAPIKFDTPSGTHVEIDDDWVREENDGAGAQAFFPTAGIATVQAARVRDATLAAMGLSPGAGGCAPNVFTEDCNNNGELDHNVVLTKTDEAGNIIATATIDEDANHDGILQLVDHVPRENSIDGRQMRYVYGGRNGSTRQMDIHFEKGMHCIDCHFIQDLHGDGHVYSTNWDAMEIECEDCHGASQRTNGKTSGPNGGNIMAGAKNRDGLPLFQVTGNGAIQRSRVTPGLFWNVPQTVDATDPTAKEAHASQHVADPGTGSTFAGAQGSTPLTAAKLECQSCHASWIHNCMGCHLEINFGDKDRITIAADGSVSKQPNENEIWLSNASDAGHTNFQLLGLMRSPFVLGVTGTAELGRLGPFRSSMQAHLSIADGNGNNVIDNATFTTFQKIDANTGRTNVATSAVAMNQTMPHTVRPLEARTCETCHQLLDQQGRVRNEPLLAQTYGLGTGNYPYLGDWAFIAGSGGIELFDYKSEHEIATNGPAVTNRFPGMIVNGTAADRKSGKVEPTLDGTDPNGVGATFIGNDVVLVRNFNPTPTSVGGTAEPTLRDLAVIAASDTTNAVGALIISDVSGRGNPSSARPSIGDATKEFTMAMPGLAHAVAHFAPDVSDPYVYVATDTAGVTVVKLLDAPNSGATAASLLVTVPLPNNETAFSEVLDGDKLYVGTVEGTIEVFDLTNPELPVSSGTVMRNGQVRAMAIGGFVLYAATDAGVAILTLDNPDSPTLPSGATLATSLPGVIGNGLDIGGDHLYVAAGTNGVIDVDVHVPAAPIVIGDLVEAVAPGETVNAQDVVVSRLPSQNWLLVSDGNGDMVGLKIDSRLSQREKCYPDPRTAGCLLDLDFVDPTIMGRDPSFNPVTGVFDSVDKFGKADPSAQPFFRETAAINTGVGTRIARGAMWEQIGTITGRRYRDSFMPGAGVLSLPVMAAMRSVQLCENATMPGEGFGGLGALGYVTPDFLSSGNCAPFGASTRHQPAPGKIPVRTGGVVHTRGTRTSEVPRHASLDCPVPRSPISIMAPVRARVASPHGTAHSAGR